MLNLSTLFNTSAEEKNGFLNNIGLTENERLSLIAARKEIRECLRIGIPAVLNVAGFDGPIPSPKFFTQGSWSYETINAPAQTPQQADLDDGVYLPMTFLKAEKRPSHASKLFFAAAETALKPLCAKNNWNMITEKATCIRIELSSLAHIDIPLYAIPDEQYVLLKASAEARAKAMDEALRQNDKWTALPTDEVLLAHREDDWKKSDPRPLKDWFEGEVEARGRQLRRIIRYLKAFRDWEWPTGGPTSILIMAAVTPDFEKSDGRDDIALLNVLEYLPTKLREGVDNPTEPSESLTDRLGAEAVEDAAVKFEEFRGFLKSAMNSTDPELACKWLIEKLGERFPNEPSWVKHTSARDSIAATAAIAGPSELIGTTKSA